MLTPLKEPRTRRARFHAYDLEWFPGSMELRMVGVKDQVRYRRYVGRNNQDIVGKFLAAELTHAHKGDWFYAHAGGLADIQFLLEYLIDDPDYRVDAAFSGSSAVIVRVRRGAASWVFVDSLFTLKTSLAKIGKLLGKEKGEVAWDAPLEVLEPYNERDCEILFDGIREFEDILIGEGSELRMTLASCAMRLFRRRYLKEPIRTHNGLNMKIRPAYVGGRVEVFYRKPVDDWRAGKVTPGWYYDVNSCYPHAMTRPMPERFVRSLNRLPDARDGECCYFADVTIRVPEDATVPVLPYVFDGSLYFPVGERRSWLCGPEIERAMECGAELLKVHECLVYRQFWDLARFAEDVYRLRMAAKGFHNYTYKILNNSCYGKFGERTDKVSMSINPTADQLKRAKAMHAASEVSSERGRRDKPLRRPQRFEKGHLHMLTPGAWMIEREVPVHNAHVPIAAYVTSEARVLLHEKLTSASALPYYCDTDGFMLPEEDARVACLHDPEWCKGACPLGWECRGKGCARCAQKGCENCFCPACRGEGCQGCLLGGLKREKIVQDSMFFAPKLYYILEESGADTVRAKGFGGICSCLRPLGSRRVETPDGPRYVDGGPDYRCPGCGMGRKDKIGRLAFERLIDGNMAIANRMLRIRELYGKGKTRPEEMPDMRHVEGGNPKRSFNRDGTSRPWHVEELHRGEHKR